jgi:hypothetical protein
MPAAGRPAGIAAPRLTNSVLAAASGSLDAAFFSPNGTAVRRVYARAGRADLRRLGLADGVYVARIAGAGLWRISSVDGRLSLCR